MTYGRYWVSVGHLGHGTARASRVYSSVWRKLQVLGHRHLPCQWQSHQKSIRLHGAISTSPVNKAWMLMRKNKAWTWMRECLPSLTHQIGYHGVSGSDPSHPLWSSCRFASRFSRYLTTHIPGILVHLLSAVIAHPFTLHWSLIRYNPHMSRQCIRFDICLPPRDNVRDFYTGKYWTESDSVKLATKPALDEVRSFSPSLFTLLLLSVD
jgi:hypothetical protein